MERWKINLYTLWITQVISLMSFGFGLPFLPFYIQQLGVSDPNQIKLLTGVLSAAPAVTMAFMSPLWGMAADRWGRKMMILRAMFSAIFIIGMMGMVSNVWQLVALRALQGVFTGTITASSAFVASNTPNDRMSFSLGFLASSTFIGFTIGPMLGGYFADAFGYRFSFFAGAVLMLIGFLMVQFLLVEDKNSFGKKPSVGVNQGKPVSIYTPLIIMMLVTLFLQRVTRSSFSPFIPLYIQETVGTHVGAAKITGWITGVAGFSTALAGLTVSRIGDRMDKLKLVKIMTAVGAVISMVLVLTKNLNIFTIAYGLMFFVIGGVEPIVTSLTAEKTPADRRGALFGMQGLVGSLGMIVAPVIGTFISLHYGVVTILVVTTVLLILNFGLVSFTKMKQQAETAYEEKP